MQMLGDLRRGATVDFKFSTVDTDGAPITLAGTPAISVYKGNNTTQTTTGVTLSVDFDTVTGLHNVRIVTTDSFYDPATDYAVVITTGTVDSVPVVGTVIAHFSIENRFQGEVYAGTLDGGAVQAVTVPSGDTVTRAGSYIFLRSGTGALQGDVVVDRTGDVCTMAREWDTQPDNTTGYISIPGSLGSTAEEIAAPIEAAIEDLTDGTTPVVVDDSTPIDANVEQINTVPITGDGSATPFGV